ncbi:hypothetical protein UlMin_014477 [Ulmus minor]
MADSSEKMSYNAGQAKGQTQEKAHNVMDKVSNSTHNIKDSIQEGGNQMKAKAEGAADSIKNATGMNK